MPLDTLPRRIVGVVGARPNFVKMAPLMRQMRGRAGVAPFLVHTGQHYDPLLSERFLDELEILPPDVNLGVGSGSHAAQTAEVMRRLEPVLNEIRPHLVLVVGDVNSTLAAALVAAKLRIPVAHVEAGLRSFDRRMPEEINRLLTDALSDLLFVTEESGRANLLREGIAPERIHFVGNVMIDALQTFRPRWERSEIRERLGLDGRPYAVATLHRPSNVDDPEVLSALLGALGEVAERLPVLLPVHPRARASLQARGALRWLEPDGRRPAPHAGVVCLPALGYLDFISLQSRARLVLTDSGGVQEEATILGVPCLTLRENTERPVTITHGTNRLIGTEPERIVAEARRALDEPLRPSGPPPLWDGRAAERIVRVLAGRAGAASPAREEE